MIDVRTYLHRAGGPLICSRCFRNTVALAIRASVVTKTMGRPGSAPSIFEAWKPRAQVVHRVEGGRRR